MGKLQQLYAIDELGLPTPAFEKIDYQTFSQKGIQLSKRLNFPVAVRSSYLDEDGDQQSHAGQYKTVLNVEPPQLQETVAAVFASYPAQEGASVIVQEMINPDLSGVLFAYRNAAWKGEWVEGLGEALVSGQVNPRYFLLPRFSRADIHWARLFPSLWVGERDWTSAQRRAFIRLSCYTRRLLKHFDHDGLDIEYAIVGATTYVLQARPITTPWEAEEVLTAANHREILPPKPSALMSGIIEGAGKRLFSYYQSADPSLPDRSFIQKSAGMPWINLSALLDVMVAWGLPTRLVSRSVGAVDVYQVGLRPWVSLLKFRVFLRLLQRQTGVARRVKDWVNSQRGWQHWRKEERKIMWEAEPNQAALAWVEDFTALYVDLVEHMQNLTAAMSGPIQLLDRLGILSKSSAALRQKSSSTDYLHAFAQLQQGIITRERFLRQYGHRGFYESDIGQTRFSEYNEDDWAVLAFGESRRNLDPPGTMVQRSKSFHWLKPITDLVHAREWLRHVTMYFFWMYRQEMLQNFRHHHGSNFDFSRLTPAALVKAFGGESPERLLDSSREEPSGWDLNTFLANRRDRRVVWPAWKGGEGRGKPGEGIGIYPGKVEGIVWRVHQAGDHLHPPQSEEPLILVADALDPGWVPYFNQVDGVVAYVGGLLSHASIMLREAGIPAVTQISEELELQTGDRIFIDGKNGLVGKIRSL